MTTYTYASGDLESKQQSQFRLSVVFNNIPSRAGLQTSWGFACLIEHGNKKVLFDTGSDGTILLSNMRNMGLDPQAVNAIVLSHIHTDHIGGIEAFLARNPNVDVFMPESFPSVFRRKMKRLGAAVHTVSGPRQLLNDLHSTGEMGKAIKEQALIVNTQQGLIVNTGCAHPDVVDMAERAKTYLGKQIYLLMGGFHLASRSDAEIRLIIRQLKALDIQKVAPSHCTGDKAIHMFRDAWKDDFIDGGLGAVIEVH